MVKKQQNIPRFMIAAAGSGSGKTTITCGLLQAFLLRGVSLCSFKCGPDYIDPMFHTEVLGLPSRNLDMFFTDACKTNELLARAALEVFDQSSSRSKLAVIEGVMGYYDGLAAISTEASSYDLARATKTPTVLLVDCKGKSVSVVAEIKGFLEYREDSQIAGVLLNRLSPMLYPDLKRMIEGELPVKVYGYLPQMQDCGLESRHLGLVTAKEIGNLKEILNRLAAQMEESVDLAGLLELAESASKIGFEQQSEAVKASLPAAKVPAEPVEVGQLTDAAELVDVSEIDIAGASVNRKRVRIGVACDKAFCFYYQDNLDLLCQLGAELVPFSPLTEKHLPEGITGLLFGGGYPELYLPQLSGNQTMLKEIREAIQGTMPCVAECGGFMYLHEWIKDEEGNRWPTVGAILGESYPTQKLGRFGYIELTAKKDTLLCAKGDVVRGHEFHYWDSTNTGDGFTAQKPLRKRSWECIIAQDHLFAGYPHLYYYSNPQTAQRFVEACRKWGSDYSGGDLCGEQRL